MSNFRRIAKRLKIDLNDFNSFMDQALNPKNSSPHKHLFDAYDQSLERIERHEIRQAQWIRANVDKPNFELDHKEYGERLKNLERQSIARLERIFKAYRHERASGN
jgi:hypothetical protein